MVRKSQIYKTGAYCVIASLRFVQKTCKCAKDCNETERSSLVGTKVFVKVFFPFLEAIISAKAVILAKENNYLPSIASFLRTHTSPYINIEF